MKRMMMAAVGVMSMAALAQSATAPQVALKPSLSSVVCQAGTRAVNDGEAFYCVRAGQDERLNGPYVGVHKNGMREAVGQYLNGERVGTWTYFDEQGTKVRTIDFRGDRYDGRYVEYHADGQVKSETVYVAGKRHGLMREFDAQGRTVAQVQFLNDRVAK